MPRVARQPKEEIYELTAEQEQIQSRLLEAERNLLTRLEFQINQSRIGPRDLSMLTGALQKLRQQSTNNIKLYGKLSLGDKAAAANPEQARKTAIAYLRSLALLDRVGVIGEAYAFDTIVQYLVQVGPVEARRIITRAKEVMDQASGKVPLTPEPEPDPEPLPEPPETPEAPPVEHCRFCVLPHPMPCPRQEAALANAAG